MLEARLEFEQPNHFKQKLNNFNSENILEKMRCALALVENASCSIQADSLSAIAIIKLMPCGFSSFIYISELILNFISCILFRSAIGLILIIYNFSRAPLSYFMPLSLHYKFIKIHFSLFTQTQYLDFLKIRWCKTIIYLNE